jgi:low affinity Fe/Cu permease
MHTNKTSTPKVASGDIASKATKWIGSSTSLVLHTIFFTMCFTPLFFGVNIDKILLFLTTIVSLEAIYLAIFIQFTVNKQSAELVEVAKDVDLIQEDIDEIQEDVGEIQEDVGEIEEDLAEIEKDIDEIEEDVENEETRDSNTKEVLQSITKKLEALMEEVNSLKK